MTTTRRLWMTMLLTAALASGVGLAAWNQSSLAQTGQGPQPTEPGDRPERGSHRGLAEAAAQLGVSEAELKAALGLPAEPPPRPDLAAAAGQLGVSETDLREALRTNMQAARQARRAGEAPDPGAALTATATQLGVNEADLRSALGIPETLPQRPDLASAAAQLGVSETELREALQSARGGMGCRQGEPAPAAQ